MGVKKGPKLVIDHLLTMQLLDMDGFWNLFPGLFDDLRDMASAATAKGVQIAMGVACAGCTSIRSVIAPVHDAVWERLDSMLAVDGQDKAAPLVAFVSGKRGYRPTTIEVYYADSKGATKRIVL